VLATLTVPATRVGLLLADGGGLVPDPSGGHKPGFGKAGPVALVVIILLFVAMGFLMWSMTKHVKKVPASFESADEEPESDESTADPSSEADADAATKQDAPRS
jgi:hypothetical protein